MEDIVWINESPEIEHLSRLDDSSAPRHTLRVVSRGTTARRSCNACSGQKIRCGAERPSCKRCSTKGISCTYMPSKRRGPRNRSGKDNRTTLGKEFEDGISEKDDVQSDAVDNVRLNLSNTEAPPLDQRWTPSTLLQDDGDWDFTFNEYSSDQHDCSEFAASEALAGTRPQRDEHTSKYTPGTYGLQHDALPTPRSGILPQSLSDDVSRSIEGPETKEGSFNRVLVHAPSRKDGCETLALSLLSGLLTKLSYCNSTKVDDEEVQSQSLNPDGRITRIQEALLQIEAFLDLPSSLRSDFWDFTYLIIKQALASYDSILKSDCAVIHYPEQDTSAEQKLSNKRAWSLSGSRHRDPTAQRLLSAYLVLMDTKNLVQPLLERLERQRDCLTERSSGSSTVSGPSSVDLRLMTLKYQHKSAEEECNGIAEAAQSVGESFSSEQRMLKGQRKRTL